MKQIALIALCACLLGGGQAYGATFGNTNVAGDYSVYSIEGVIRGATVTLSENAVLTSMTAYIYVTSAVKRARCMIYKESDTSLVAVTESIILPVSTGAGGEPHTFNFNYAVALTSGNYIICCYAQSTTGSCILGSDAGASGDSYRDTEAITSYPPNPTIRSAADGTVYYCIYVTYTPGTLTTLGYTTAGTTTTTVKETIKGGIFTTHATDSTLLSTINAHFAISTAAGEIDTVRGILYKASDLSYMDTTYQIKIYADSCPVVGALQMWRRFTFPTAKGLAKNTAYVLCLHGGHFSSASNIHLTTSGGSGMESDDVQPFDTSPPDPLEDLTTANYNVSIFGEYTSPVAASVKGRRRKIILGQPMGLVQEATETFAGSVDEVTR